MRAGLPRKDMLDAVSYGLHYGVVCQNKDPDNKNRIKVKLPWLDQGDQEQTYWAQVITPMEGDKFGWYTLPDVDDVVAVMFIAGDFSQPIILGGVWSKTDNSPEPNSDGKNNFRGYRSRAGARLVFDDSSKVKVYIADKTGKNMIGVGAMDSDGDGPNKCAIHKPPMSGTDGVSIATVEGKFEMTAKGKLTIKGQNIKINSKQAMDIKAGGDVQLEGGSAATLTASSNSNYDGPTIKIL